MLFISLFAFKFISENIAFWNRLIIYGHGVLSKMQIFGKMISCVVP